MSHDELYEESLKYHQNPPGKIAVALTKPAETAHDLSLAYSPGVAEPVRQIAKDPDNAYKYTSKGNSVAIISNGTAILGMEGKAFLFKKFANIDAVDIEVKHKTVDEFINTVENIADSFGGINLEDIKAPECFIIERELIKRCNVPVFHDDQHGTAIVTCSGMLNACQIQGKKIEEARVVCVGAGAAAAGVACMDLLLACGLKKENLFMCDRHGVIRSERDDLNGEKPRFINDSGPKTLKEALTGADILVGVSGPNLVSEDEVMQMAPNAIIFACSNPEPEVSPELVKRVRPDIIMATGRSDYPNQINNVICFPFLFRGTLDVRAKCINVEMMKAAMNAIRMLAHGKDYMIPKPMDPRLLKRVARAVAQAAVDTGVAQLPMPEHYMEE